MPIGFKHRFYVLKSFPGILFLFFLFLHGYASSEENVDIPPSDLPVIVTAKIHLINLISIDGRTETFKADIYFDVTWKDSRQAFSNSNKSNDPRIYTEDAAKNKIEDIWWPELEFVNTTVPDISNRSLFIYPDGTVNYLLGLSSVFRSPYDFHKFPFDDQKLEIIVCSFIWDEKVVKFETAPEYADLEVNKSKVVNGFNILDIKGEIVNEQGAWSHKKDNYSCFRAVITVKRNSLYYIYQICFPLFIVLAYGCCIFITDPKDFANRLMLGLTCMFVFIAIKLAINIQLPEIAYVTVADQVFFLAYLNVALILIISLIEWFLYKRKSPHFTRFDRAAFWIMPTVFFCLFLLIIIAGQL